MWWCKAKSRRWRHGKTDLAARLLQIGQGGARIGLATTTGRLQERPCSVQIAFEPQHTPTVGIAQVVGSPRIVGL